MGLLLFLRRVADFGWMNGWLLLLRWDCSCRLRAWSLLNIELHRGRCIYLRRWSSGVPIFSSLPSVPPLFWRAGIDRVRVCFVFSRVTWVLRWRFASCWVFASSLVLRPWARGRHRSHRLPVLEFLRVFWRNPQGNVLVWSPCASPLFSPCSYLSGAPHTCVRLGIPRFRRGWCGGCSGTCRRCRSSLLINQINYSLRYGITVGSGSEVCLVLDDIVDVFGDLFLVGDCLGDGVGCCWVDFLCEV